jgi:hypothetical protein
MSVHYLPLPWQALYYEQGKEQAALIAAVTCMAIMHAAQELTSCHQTPANKSQAIHHGRFSCAGVCTAIHHLAKTNLTPCSQDNDEHPIMLSHAAIQTPVVPGNVTVFHTYHWTLHCQAHLPYCLFAPSWHYLIQQHPRCPACCCCQSHPQPVL